MKSHCHEVYICTHYALITTFMCICMYDVYIYIMLYVRAYFNDAYSVHAVGVLRSYVDHL